MSAFTPQLSSKNAHSRAPLASVLPPLMLGTATFNTQHVEDPSQMPCRQIVQRAFELGVNGFDTSPYYGPSEILLGDALAAHASTFSTPRSSYFIATKAGRIGPQEFDYTPEHVRSSVLRSLERLHTSYIDLVYMHDVEFVSPMEVLEAVKTLRQLQAQGLVRYVGISGFPVDVLCSLSEMILGETNVPLDAVLSYGHFTIQNPVLGLHEITGARNGEMSPLQRFKTSGVQVVLNASMLGMGLLTHNGIPTAEESAQAEGKGALIAKWHPSPADLRLKCRDLAVIAEAEGHRLENVALRWSMEEYAHVGALAGLGVELPEARNVRVGGSVMGVTAIKELDQTVDLWRDILASMGKDGNRSDMARMVEEKMWPALGKWMGYAWASPEPGFKNKRQVMARIA
ncbi:L-galactose dehydrogenase [Plectosphaerella plurivora]|uniref:L-galactose dehydrogenase n=1 Tax=Plectosphaerella plurivora TaxID=936078 RepID=A0A9P8V4P1_9PEZI|nr:L-galactose dehydrogenase [Plectosphaerella plurivora]